MPNQYSKYKSILDREWEDISLSSKRKYMIELYNNSCQLCGFSNTKRLNDTSILELHHIDGDYRNNNIDNVQILCPNCHSLTDNFKNNGNKKNKKLKDRQRLKRTQNYTDTQKEFEALFVKTILNLYETNVIDFNKLGWVTKVSDFINRKPQVIGRAVRRLMPEFYEMNCYKRYSSQRINATKTFNG